jgi:hypothetical protein
MKAKISNYHWTMYNYQHDDLRGEPVPVWFNVVITITTILMLVTGQ